MELKIPGKIWNGSCPLLCNLTQKHLGQKSAKAIAPRSLPEIRTVSVIPYQSPSLSCWQVIFCLAFIQKWVCLFDSSPQPGPRGLLFSTTRPSFGLGQPSLVTSCYPLPNNSPRRRWRSGWAGVKFCGTIFRRGCWRTNAGLISVAPSAHF